MNPKDLYLSKPWLKFYSEGVPAEAQILDISVPELFDGVAEKYGSKAALIFYGKTITYRELKGLVDRFATALADLGVKKGDTVALYLLNSPQYVIAYFATLRLGAKVTPISPVYTSIEVKHQIEDSEAGTVVCQDILYDNLEKAGVHPERVVLTSIDEYLPSLKKWFGKSAKAKA
ncbi:MAG: AMP-dependent synthetase, partial [Syntrophus sp. (in: bacteria)]|nr:AMP-dependent synthetase [Syntrophus sp. (in: bacteria)]